MMTLKYPLNPIDFSLKMLHHYFHLYMHFTLIYSVARTHQVSDSPDTHADSLSLIGLYFIFAPHFPPRVEVFSLLLHLYGPPNYIISPTRSGSNYFGPTILSLI